MPSSNVGIIAAMVPEARALMTRQPVPAHKFLQLPQGVLVQISGLGARRASLAAKILLEKSAHALMSWGGAGALIPQLPAGGLIIPKTVIAGDQTVYHCDTIWHERIVNQVKDHLALYTGPVAESEAVVTDSAAKKNLFLRTGAIAVDMESAAVGLEAQKAGVPFIVVRAVVDTVEMTIPQSLITCVNDFGQVRFLNLLAKLLPNPGEIVDLLRLARNFRIAQATLRTVARLSCKDRFFLK